MPKIMVRRVGPEIIELSEMADATTLSWRENGDLDITVEGMKDLEKAKVTMTISRHYPFVAPTVTVNSKPYASMLCHKVSKLRSIEKELSRSSECVCCKSMTCDNNWYPALTISSLLCEVVENLQVRQRILHIYYCRVIASEHLTHDVPLEKYL